MIQTGWYKDKFNRDWHCIITKYGVDCYCKGYGKLSFYIHTFEEKIAKKEWIACTDDDKIRQERLGIRTLDMAFM